MKKRALAVTLAVLMAASLSACGSSNSGSGNTTAAPAETTTAAETKAAEAETTAGTAVKSESSDGYELALVTDLGTIDDKSFNQGAWEGMKKYAEENGISYKYYQPQEGTTDSYLETIGLAIEGGAKLVVCPGFLFEEPVYLAQDQYKDVHFILLDGEPHSGDYSEYRTEANTMPILFQEDEPGFLAGYAAVKDGYTKLGFLGGMAVPAVIRYGYGFAEGADYAAKEMGVDGIEIMYNYTGAFAATPEAQSMAASWYQNGTEVIFGCGGAVGNSVMAAAEEKSAKVIGVDVDQSYESDTVITSAMKQLSVSVYDGVRDFYAGSFPGGKTSIFSAKNDGIGLPMETSKFTNFTQADYDAVYSQLKDGKITLVQPSEDNNDPTKDLTLEKTTINFVE
ncbi:BMP family ABC transporter substrate-binding protein [Hungatella hathewayi]|uniref:BMP family ABC transporter substrate-binding protein n=1 Tax=Hungatella hathewayi TaxID=154046 RepID=A0AAW9WEX7_9FIRM|nr:BMP family ABC transporter substrate-binding protein [Hungatella hathewayi]MUB63311.1 BMP family ABC transporter substrate-binding protein [Hungatella hathewayi]CCZ58751.1 putative membrane lipoprotein TmpC [Hungatella hathewayi CAG:224]